MKMYGSHLCPDVREAIETLKERGIEYDYADITTDLADLKAFLKIRETSPLFDAVKEAGGIGIPCFVKDNGQVSLDVGDFLE